MSADYEESDAELKALRNELLNGLDKKQTKKKTSLDSGLIEQPCVENDQNKEEEDNELELLRLEALNAKRNKTKIISNIVPGRFRYDKDSGDDEDEDEEDEIASEENYLTNQTENLNNLEEEKNICLLSDTKKSIEYDPSDSMPVNLENSNYTGRGNNFNYSEFTSYTNTYSNRKANYFNDSYYSRGNYLTYRNECSKLMSNDAYDPKSIVPENTNSMNNLPPDFDLRNFLREKALKQQEQLEMESDDFISDNPNAVVYSEPITKPIEISSELFEHNKYRSGPYSSRFNNSYDNMNKRRAFSSGCNNNSELRNENEKSRLLSETKISGENNRESGYEDNDDDDSEDESYLNNKKLKSVVAKAIISNEDKSAEFLECSNRESSMIRDRHSYRSSFKRK